MGDGQNQPEDIVQISVADGKAFIEQASPLTRLHYFDGKYLRADALEREQAYHRTRTRLSNLGGGWGVVHGLGVRWKGNELTVAGGLAITPAGNFVLASGDLKADLGELLTVAQAAAATPATGKGEFGACVTPSNNSVNAIPALGIFEITVGPVEGLCGNEAVYGKLCETACVTSSQHPYYREGVALRLRPIGLELPSSSAFSFSEIHLRNRVASAYFSVEPWLTASALGSAGLAGGVWCGTAQLYGRDEVVIGLIVRDGATNRVLDAWGGRRERMDTQSRGYWQGRMEMRPWNVFIAQILQFQCQLSGALDQSGTLPPPDDCEQLRTLLDKTRKELEALQKQYSDGARKILERLGEQPTPEETKSLAAEVTSSYAQLFDISGRLADADVGSGGVLPKDRMLLRAGFVQLPPAGYLPVRPGKNDLHDQLKRAFGPGVKLEYHAVHRDEIPHLVEEAQHMQRISLTRGLDDPKQVEAVEIFVPEGEPFGIETSGPGKWWRAEVAATISTRFDIGLITRGLDVSGLLRDRPETAFVRQFLGPITPDLQQILLRYVPPFLQGLLRTEARPDGTYGYTMVVSLDAQDLARKLREEFGNDLTTALKDLLSRLDRQLLAAYYAGDLGRDPFALAVGDETTLKAEVNLLGEANRVDGRLIATGVATKKNGSVERRVRVEYITTYADGRLEQVRGELSLSCFGDSTNGRFVLDDAKHDPSSPPNTTEWSDFPASATMWNQVATGEDRLRESDRAVIPRRSELAKLLGLTAMPSPSSALGSTAINALSRLGEGAQDATFLARARQRLFPTLDDPASQGVRPILDWVMFRRARTNLCCREAPAPVVTPDVVEAISLWQFAAINADGAERVVGMLDGGSAELPVFQRVGLLRYRDDHNDPVESAQELLAEWQATNPGAEVVFGRYWAGPNAANQLTHGRARIERLLNLLPVTMPSVPDNAIKPLPNVVPPFVEAGIDGGMILITALRSKVRPHRVLVIKGSLAERFGIQNEPSWKWAQLEELVAQNRDEVIDVLVSFQDEAQLIDETVLLEPVRRFAEQNPSVSFLAFMRVDAATLDANIDPVSRHRIISKLVVEQWQTPPSNAPESVRLHDQLLGDVQTATIVLHATIG